MFITALQRVTGKESRQLKLEELSNLLKAKNNSNLAYDFSKFQLQLQLHKTKILIKITINIA